MNHLTLLGMTLAALTLPTAAALQGTPASAFQYPAGHLCSMVKFANGTAVTYRDFKLPLPAFLAWDKVQLMIVNVGLDNYHSFSESSTGQGYHVMHCSGTTSVFGVNIYMNEIDREQTEICISTID